jgi:hypothetical protein
MSPRRSLSFLPNNAVILCEAGTVSLSFFGLARTLSAPFLVGAFAVLLLDRFSSMSASPSLSCSDAAWSSASISSSSIGRSTVRCFSKEKK